MPPEFADPEFYELLRDIPNRPNVYIFGYTEIEHLYSFHVKRVDIGKTLIKPVGKNVKSKNLQKIYDSNTSDIFYVPTYHNETLYMNLSQKLDTLGIQNSGQVRFQHVSDLLKYKGIICIPYAWSTLTFFEVMQLGVVYFVPSISFLIQLSQTPGMDRFWFQPPYNYDPTLLKAAEWYCDDFSDILVYFDSWEDLVKKVKTTDYEVQTQKILNCARAHLMNTLSGWNRIIEDYNQKLLK
jgi:hypothetical protein